MTLESQIAEQLQIIGRTYPLTAPQGSLTPYLTYQRVSGREHETLANGGGAPRVRVQIDVWDTSFANVHFIAENAKVLLRASLKIGEITDNPDTFEPDTRLYRASFDAAIWA